MPVGRKTKTPRKGTIASSTLVLGPQAIAYPPIPVAGTIQVLDAPTMAEHGAAIRAAALMLYPYAKGARALPRAPTQFPVDS